VLRRPYQWILKTEAGRLTITRAGAADYNAVMTILREAADWLSSRGNAQWMNWYTKFGEQMLRELLEHHEVYLARRDTAPAGTLTIRWADPDVWGERGLDGRAGYIHALAITRSIGGMRVGERLLEWAVETIASRDRRFARLDAMASNAALCSYYERRGFRPLGTAMLFGNWTSRLFERDLGAESVLRPSS
jgi:ribosomal protein S18 acetylase RimI-like enzyme